MEVAPALEVVGAMEAKVMAAATVGKEKVAT